MGGIMAPGQLASRTGCNHWPSTTVEGCVEAHPIVWDLYLQGSVAHWLFPLSVSLVEKIRWCLHMVWSCPLGELYLRPSRKYNSKFSHCLCSAWGLPAWTTRQSLEGCYLCWAWKYPGEAHLWTKASLGPSNEMLFVQEIWRKSAFVF